jgi:ABC-type hemin transport system substrate-binding protein
MKTEDVFVLSGRQSDSSNMLENYTEIQRMKQQKKLFLLVISLVISLLANTIAIAGAGRTGAQILNLGGGTRAASLGDAFSAIGGDVTSIFWNPSGLSKLK